MEIVFASRNERHPEDWVRALQEALPGYRVRIWGDGSPQGRAEAAIVWNPPEDLFEREPRLRIMFNLGAGVDALLGMRARPLNLPIVRLEDGGMAVQMAEYVVHFLVRTARDFDRYAQFQTQRRWQRLPDIVREDWPVGVMGAGVMGARVARTVAGLEYPVAVWSRSGHAPEGIDAYGGPEGLSAFLARTRVLVNVLPLTAQTEGILCRRTFECLRPDAYLINIARGRHLVEEDLAAALDDGLLRGAALDVFVEEPLPTHHPFWADARVQVTPHIAGVSLMAQTVRQISRKILAFARGESISGIIDPEQQY